MGAGLEVRDRAWNRSVMNAFRTFDSYSGVRAGGDLEELHRMDSAENKAVQPGRGGCVA